ncbi:MAG: ASKHA domain-containing protein [Clostridiales Family XIII bacterium]|jgi:uncharacterized 2Fe-2S/4Fe-4S cluster protein (DUF4445 family)|nr:ASKHA domain-containing protein [Clostridiales Family XIII bacterium]
MPIIRFLNEDTFVPVDSGTTILEAARSANIALEAPCNGMGTCGKCDVTLGDGSVVLSCQYEVTHDITVLVPNKTAENLAVKIISKGETFEYNIAPNIRKDFNGSVTQVWGGDLLLGEELGDTSALVYGIALDIGTTTLVAELIHLNTGDIVAQESMLNPQTAYAQDVLSRIHFASEEGGITTLYDSFLSAFYALRDALSASAGVDTQYIYEVIFSGNTAMLHMATGTNPVPLGKYPYISNIDDGEVIAADDYGISPFGIVYLPPIISAFVGADITSGILASRLHKRKGTVLFIDIGTNGEMVLAHDNQLAATSTAAGPAFEGMNITCGMRAAPGAIEEFLIADDDTISIKTIGDQNATGICGSGLLDIVGELARTNIVGKTGRFDKKKKDIFGELNGKPVYPVSDDVILTQADVRQVQLAKGAIRSGITALLAQLEVAEENVDEVLIAGSFGYHLREESLLNIGLLPAAFRGKVQFIGNTSQSGAAAFLLNAEIRDEMKSLVESIDKIELANTPGFEKLFIDSLNF